MYDLETGQIKKEYADKKLPQTLKEALEKINEIKIEEDDEWEEDWEEKEDEKINDLKKQL